MSEEITTTKNAMRLALAIAHDIGKPWNEQFQISNVVSSCSDSDIDFAINVANRYGGWSMDALVRIVGQNR